MALSMRKQSGAAERGALLLAVVAAPTQVLVQRHWSRQVSRTVRIIVFVITSTIWACARASTLMALSMRKQSGAAERGALLLAIVAAPTQVPVQHHWSRQWPTLPLTIVSVLIGTTC